MAKAILICGRIGSGKSVYAEKLRLENKAAVLSCDEITLAVSSGCPGEILPAVKEMLFRKSLELLETDIDVILEWGFWSKAERDSAREFYESRGITCEFHYIQISDELQRLNLDERNLKVESGQVRAYIFDEEKTARFNEKFEEPCISEIDVWSVCERTVQ